MSEYVLCELHCHTFHSDGQQTLLQLAQQAKELGLDAVALTDHNTHAGHVEIEDVCKKTGIKIIKGIEYTTFYGHVVTIGNPVIMSFKHFDKTGLPRLLAELKGADRVVGIAHPFAVGNPICTGCHFEYDKEDPYFDYIEIWSRKFSTHHHVMTELAMNFWTKLLNEGRTICGVLGRDWHEPEEADHPIASTAIWVPYAVTQENIGTAVVEAIQNRKVCLTLYKVLSLEVVAEGEKYYTGDIISSKISGEITISMAFIDKMLPHNQDRFTDLSFTVCSNQGILCNEKVADETKTYVSVQQSQGLTWLRLEAYGDWEGEKVLVAVTNPIFFKGV